MRMVKIVVAIALESVEDDITAFDSVESPWIRRGTTYHVTVSFPSASDQTRPTGTEKCWVLFSESRLHSGFLEEP